MGRKLGATHAFGKAAKRLIIVVLKPSGVHLREAFEAAGSDAKPLKLGAIKKPGLIARAFCYLRADDQAAGL